MSGAEIARSARTQRSVFPRPRSGDTAKQAVFYALMVGALLVAALGLATILIDRKRHV